MSDLPAALSFLGVQEPIERAAVVVLPVPYDLTTTYQPGARFGPRALLTASLNVELFDEELRWDPSRVGIHTLEPLEPLAVGPQAMVPLIREQVEEIFLAGKFPIVLGGDHSVSIGALEALARRWENPWVLQIDAHADLREEYQGSPFSHACVMARARESFPCVQVGVRSWSAEEDAALWERPERVILAREAEEDPEAAAERRSGLPDDRSRRTRSVDPPGHRHARAGGPALVHADPSPSPGGGEPARRRLRRDGAQPDPGLHRP